MCQNAGRGQAAEHPAEHTPAMPDLDTLLMEVGQTYPLIGFAAEVDDELGHEEALNAAILAGLASPTGP
jgi:hypothetical protein